jgi:hypothetical protein
MAEQGPNPESGAETLHDTPYGQAVTRDGKAFLREGGRLRTVNQGELDAAMRTGRYELASVQEIQKVDHDRRVRAFNQKEGAVGTLQAFGEGAARSVLDTATLAPRLLGADVATGGELLERFVGDEGYGERQRMRAEGSPIASLLGQAAPEVLALLGSGGTATALKAGGKTALKRMGKAAAVDVVAGGAAGAQAVTEQAWREQTPVDSERLVEGGRQGGADEGHLPGQRGHRGARRPSG